MVLESGTWGSAGRRGFVSRFNAPSLSRFRLYGELVLLELAVERGASDA
jgi:hypothetical protein